MFLLTFLLLIVVAVLLVAFVVPFLRLLVRQRTSPLRHLPGPLCPSFFMGNLVEMHDQENNNLILKWQAQYGTTFVYHGFIGGPRLMTTDPVAIAHVLAHAYQYPKPDFVRDSLASMAAGHEGILTVEGEQHRRQRKILSPAFSALHIKTLTPIFWDKAIKLRNIWFDQVDATEAVAQRIDVLAWLARATLDIIGEAGFGYHFNSLSATSTQNELSAAFGVIFSTARKFRVITILQVWFPILRRFRRNSAAMNKARETMDRIGMELIERKRAEVSVDLQQDKQSSTGRDLLSVLIRSNMSNLSPASQNMSTSEVLCQISTFIAAGHETTASALTWCLYALARDQRVQTELRRALRKLQRSPSNPATPSRHHTNHPDSVNNSPPETTHPPINYHENEESSDALTTRIQGCTYLDWVVRESLRLHAPATSTMRVCSRPGGDSIPISRPLGECDPSCDGEDSKGTRSGYRDTYGEQRWNVPVAEGDIITIPIQAVNRCQRLWGADAWDFKPERWASLPETARAIPGLFAHTLTFLNGNGSVSEGNRACIGWRFALIEIKIFLYTLVKDLEFTIDGDMVIEKKVNVVTRPFVKSEPHLGNQMPLNVRRAPP
ncbi:hypothetical protein Hypma_000804 [Hypsizygus marmoreus]|uniref:Cytochrome P450 n=1 Tax=Hypsizygus marmoreus TaxID=39966 RepID=A0A369J770_HYPMA|nr:hypothetical protein Hypma_000804 [Hypsizygus marmoreus]